MIRTRYLYVAAAACLSLFWIGWGLLCGHLSWDPMGGYYVLGFFAANLLFLALGIIGFFLSRRGLVLRETAGVAASVPIMHLIAFGNDQHLVTILIIVGSFVLLAISLVVELRRP